MSNQLKRGQEEEPGPSSSKRLRLRNQDQNNSINGSFERVSYEDDLEYEKSGILEWIVVKNFMCHDHLNFEFSPHINFVQGRNGSGKSAILAAVVLGLGGATRITNRGNSIKEVIKHGKQTATIEIGIKNTGSNAFKPEVYGKSIIVERKISTTSGGGYRLKSSEGAVVSNKKEELCRVMEHFNLQVDNPVTILNQDMSRSFFNTTDPKMLFKLFTKATQLQQVKDDYGQVEKTIESTMKIINCRKECLPDLEKEVEDQRIHYQLSLSHRKKGEKLKNLRHELAWAKIIQNEREKKQAEEAFEKCSKKRGKLQNEIQALQEAIEEETENRKINHEKLKEANDQIASISEEIRVKANEARKAKNEYKDSQAQFQIKEKKVRTKVSEISMLKTAIENNNKRAQSNWAAERAKWQKNIDMVESKMKEVLATIATEKTHLDNLNHTMQVKLSDNKKLEIEENALGRQLNNLDKELKGLENQKGNQLTIYGQWVPQLLKKIDAAYSKGLFTKKPVGPLGAFIEVKDTKWSHIAERVLGRRITSFCVNNRADEKVLRTLMGELNFEYSTKPIVSVSKFRDKILDVSKFEVVSPNYSSLWSMLSISNTVVANTVIDLMQVESILLIPTSQEAGKLLMNKKTVPRNCKCAYTLNFDQYYPDPNYRLYSGRGNRKSKYLQVSVKDRIREVIANMDECRGNKNVLASQLQESQREIKTIKEEINESNVKSKHAKEHLDFLRTSLANLQNQETPPPPRVDQLEEDIKQQEKYLITLEAEMEECHKQVTQCKETYNRHASYYLELKQKEKDCINEVDRCKKLVDETNSNAARSELKIKKNKNEVLQKELKDLEKAVTETTSTLETALKTANTFNVGERIETKRSVTELERQYTSLQARIAKERAITGDPLSVAESYMATKQRYKQISEDLNNHMSFINKLKESLVMREAGYTRLLKWLAVIVKYFFQEHLSQRKLDGSIYINPDEQTLNIKVEKPGINSDSPSKEVEVIKNKKKKKKGSHLDLIMMSGGERSFATVSFIIALWHAIISPVRILDEFDVFMDVVARNRAMKMMISTANPDCQYIFLTPLSMDTSRLHNCVFFRMPDPIRDEDTTNPNSSNHES